MKRFKNLTAIVLTLALMMSIMAGCKSNTNETVVETTSPTSIEITFETEAEETETDPSETTEAETEELLPYDEYETSVIMYGNNARARYWSGSGVNAVAEGYIEIGNEYEVIGESATSYYIRIDGNIYRVSKTALSADVPEEVTEETEPTDATEPTDETRPTEPTSGTQPTTAPTNPPPSSVEYWVCEDCAIVFYAQSDYNRHMSSVHSPATPTTAPRPTNTPTPAPSTPTPAPATPTPAPCTQYGTGQVGVNIDFADGTRTVYYYVPVERQGTWDTNFGEYVYGRWIITVSVGDLIRADYGPIAFSNRWIESVTDIHN